MKRDEAAEARLIKRLDEVLPMKCDTCGSSGHSHCIAPGFPTRPHKFGEPVKRTYTHEDLRAMMSADEIERLDRAIAACHEQEERDDRGRDAIVERLKALDACPECKEPASEPCEWFETEEREQ